MGDWGTVSHDLCPLGYSPESRTTTRTPPHPPPQVFLAVPGVCSPNKPDSAAVKTNGFLHHAP